MTDEVKAAIVAGIWLGFLTVFCAEPGAMRGLLLIFVTVVLVMYVKHDAEQENLRRSRKRYADHADSEIRRNIAARRDEQPEDRIKRIIGGFR